MVDIRDAQTSSAAKVDSLGRLSTLAVTRPDFVHIAATTQQVYSFSSTFATGGTDIEVISIKNDSSTLVLQVVSILVSAAAVTTWTLFEVTSGTPGGTSLTPVNLDLESGNAAEATAFGNAAVTGSLAGNTLSSHLTPANSAVRIQIDGTLRIHKDDVIAITASANTTVHVTVIGFFNG